MLVVVSELLQSRGTTQNIYERLAAVVKYSSSEASENL